MTISSGTDEAHSRDAEEQSNSVARHLTMEDVAKAAGVSRSLVSIVYRGVEGASEDTRRRILKVGDEIGYRRNTLASQLATKTPQSVGVLLFDARNELSIDVFTGIQEAADEADIRVVAGISDPSGRRDGKTLNDLLASQVGVIIMLSSAMPGRQVRELAKTTPIISVTRSIEGIDSVVIDEAEAGDMIVSHLVENGHRKIVHLAPGWRPSDRVDGYIAAMRKHGLEPQVETIAYDATDVAEVTKRILDSPDRPDAIYANNDVAAYAVSNAVRQAGFDIPNDIALVGFDNLATSEVGPLPLTSIDQRAALLGRRALEIAQERINGIEAPPRRHVYSPELIIRESSVRSSSRAADAPKNSET